MTDTKICGKCKAPQPLNEYHKCTRAKDGLQNRCKSCDRISALVWRHTPAGIEANRRNGRIFYHKHKHEPKFQLSQKMRQAMHRSLNRAIEYGETWRVFEYVDWTVEDLMIHLQTMFGEEYTWEGYVKGLWHVDHIIAVSHFYYECYTDQGFQDCWALSNLQPLWGPENSRKGALMPADWAERKASR